MPGIILTVVFVLILIAVLSFLVIALNPANPKGRQVDVRVISCEQNMSANGFYEAKVDFCAPNGEVLVRTLRSRKPYIPGDVIRCRYIEKTGLMLEDMAPEVRKRSRNSVLLFLAIFLVFIGITVTVLWRAYAGREVSNGSVLLFGYIIGIVFMAIGVFGICHKMQLKQKMQDMISLPGIQVDYETVRDYMDDNHVTTFRPIYEYEWGGEKRKIYSRLRSSTKKYRTIGRRVHILVNPQTGQAICQEDEKTGGNMYLLFGIIGIATLALMLALSFGVL